MTQNKSSQNKNDLGTKNKVSIHTSHNNSLAFVGFFAVTMIQIASN